MDVTVAATQEDVLTLLEAGPLSPLAEERAIPRLDEGLRAEYERLFAQCKIRAERAQVVDSIVDRLAAAKGRYGGIESTLGTPWYFTAAIHSLESGQRFDRHLHNGDPLTRRTTHVPTGRPARGIPPFTWEASAQDALELKGLHRWQDWSIGGVLFKLEEYNGWGYRQFHPDVKSPYLWSFCQHYTKGKYVADGRYDPNAVSQQCGAAVLLRRMVDRGLIPGWGTPPAGPLFRYSGGAVMPRGAELQRFLNTLPDTELDEDGQLGPLTSDAVRRAFGRPLMGDPRDRMAGESESERAQGETGMAQPGDHREERLDWDAAEMHPGVAGGLVLVVRGVAPVPTRVTLRPLPVGVVPEDYNGIEVVGVREEPTVEVQTPWTTDIDTQGLGGRKGVVLIGATKREYLPPESEAEGDS